MILQVRHDAKSFPPRFSVLRLPDGTSTGDPVEVPSPVGFPVEGWPDKKLLPGLQWYLEQFLDYPFDPETMHAQCVQNALRLWGTLAFKSLFDNLVAGSW